MSEISFSHPKIKMMVTAASSNSGKTSVTCGLLSLLKDRGLDPCAFKCGPDYIDPMFHRSVLEIPSCNLDVFLAGEDGVKDIFLRHSTGHGAAVCEGVMGYYDGRSVSSAEASAWHVADLLGMSSLLVMRPKGAALTLAAVIEGLVKFRSPSRIKGVLFNDCSEMFYRTYARAIEEETGIPVLGHLPHMEEAAFGSRHLGLMTADEIADLGKRIKAIGRRLEETVDIERLLRVFAAEEKTGIAEEKTLTAKEKTLTAKVKTKTAEEIKCAPSVMEINAEAEMPVRIAVARDKAFSFIYEESLTALKAAGAELVFFSPVNDSALPEDIHGIYLPGGYPEVYAEKLSKNGSMLRSVADAVKSGMPTIAECGGFLYMGEVLEDTEGCKRRMAGVLPGEGVNAGHLVRFGYGFISSEKDTMLLRRGESAPVHEFHYWDSTGNGGDMQMVKASTGKKWDFGYASETLYAGFPHLYLAGEGGRLAKRFADAAREHREQF